MALVMGFKKPPVLEFVVHTISTLRWTDDVLINMWSACSECLSVQV